MAPHRRRVDDYRDAVARSALPSSAKLVAHAMSHYMHYSNLGGAYPGPARIAREVGMSTRTVERWLSALTARGWLEKTTIGGSFPTRRATVYRGRIPGSTSDSPDTGQRSATSDSPDTITSVSADGPTLLRSVKNSGRRAAPDPDGPAPAPKSYVIDPREVA